MTLSSLIRKRDTVSIATAIPAIPATQPKEEAATVARIATVAVAKSPQGQTAHTAEASTNAPAIVSPRWLIHYSDRDLAEVACWPDATHAEILERYPDAIAAEPLNPAKVEPHTRPRETCKAGAAHIPADLEARILAMAKRWTYSDDDLATVMTAAHLDPAGWWRVVESDECETALLSGKTGRLFTHT